MESPSAIDHATSGVRKRTREFIAQASITKMIERVRPFMTKSELAYEALVQAIQSGDLKAGQKVTLGELAERLGMSLTPVRDALTLLGEQGLVIRKPHYATVIAEQTIARSSEVSMIRAMLEPETARLAALNADQVQIGEIAAVYEASLAAARSQDFRELSRLNEQFHAKVAEASGSSLLAEMIANLWKTLPVQGLTLSGDTETILRDHGDILAAIRNGEADRAHMLMANHVGHAADRTKEYLAKIRRT